ncbi:MAG: SEC-C metal-binding domain-containing protein [Candidatus Sulfotelmatobacter sp.]
MKQAKVMLANTPVIQKPVMRGRDRNLPCSCGSGKKFKKCCGR